MKIYKVLFFATLFIFSVTIFSPAYAIENETLNQEQYTNVEENYKNLLSCGAINGKKALIEDIPPSVPKIVHIIYLVIQIAVPILLVIFGTLDLFKGLYAQKEDEIKKGQQMFVKRLIAAAIVFFVFMIVKLLIGAVADSNGNQIINCAECFIENNCD